MSSLRRWRRRYFFLEKSLRAFVKPARYLFHSAFSSWGVERISGYSNWTIWETGLTFLNQELTVFTMKYSRKFIVGGVTGMFAFILFGARNKQNWKTRFLKALQVVLLWKANYITAVNKNMLVSEKEDSLSVELDWWWQFTQGGLLLVRRWDAA
jgi:hypothetical protein